MYQKLKHQSNTKTSPINQIHLTYQSNTPHLSNKGLNMLLYLYDIHATDLKQFNRVKRRFYYAFNRSWISKCVMKTKSVLYVDEIYEIETDAFFKKFENKMDVYKALCTSVEKIL